MLNQESHTGPTSAEDIRDIIKENLKELIPQYLRNAYAEPKDLTIENQHNAPGQHFKGPSPPSPGIDDDIFSQKGGADRPPFSRDFTFKVPSLQTLAGDKKRNDGIGGPLLPPSLTTFPVEGSGVGRRMAFQLRTPTQKHPHGTDLFVDRGRTTHMGLRQSTASQQSGVQRRPSEHPPPRDTWNSATADTPSMVFEGSSPTLHATASRSLNRSVSRSLGQLPAKPQGTFCIYRGFGSNDILSGTFNDRLPRPSTGPATGRHVSATDPLALGEVAPPLPEPSRHVRRTDSTKSLPDDRRRRNGMFPTLTREKLRPKPWFTQNHHHRRVLYPQRTCYTTWE